MSIFSIQYPPGVKSSFQAALDGFMTLEQRSCTLFFPPLPQQITDGQNQGVPVGSDLSTSVWSAGMPQPGFSQMNNPYEDSLAIANIETTGTVQMVIYPNPSKFSDVFPIGERTPDQLIGSRGYVSDLHLILNCVRMETFNEIAQAHFNYKLDGEPVFPGTLIANRYFYAIWKRL